jgi:ketosteroid isomerase-like protein
VGKEEIRDAYQHYFDAFDKEEGTLTWHQAGHQGNVVWVAGMSTINSYFKNEKTEFAMNWTFVLEKKDGAWKIVQRHISNISPE